MTENDNSYAGRRYLCQIRCSTNQQIDTSIPDQQKLLRAFGDQYDMIYVDSVILEGVTGSVPGARNDIEQIIQRKKTANDFDVLLVQDVSRLTRAGAEHGMKLKYDLAAAGIEVIFANEGIRTGDHGGIIDSVGFYAAQQYAKSLSFAVTRGLMSSLENGRIAHTLCIPYGVDRLIVSLDNRPLHVIRNLSDGTQQKLDPKTGVVLATFESQRGSNSARHYRMQSNEKVVLVPGAPERVEVVRHMFRRRLIDGWAGFRIARELDQMGIRSGSGKPWCVTSINSILKNPVYTGVGIANRYSAAIYNRRSKHSPKPSMTDRKTLAHRKKPKQQVRPRNEWIEIEHPMLRDYLGDLRDRASAWQKEQLTKQDRSRLKTRSSKDRHVGSSYFLKGILKSTDGHRLTGRTVGNPKTRYYAIHRGFTTPKLDKTMRRLIPAEQLERAVLDMVRAMILETPGLKDRLVAQIEIQRKQNNAAATDLTKLEKERAKLAQQIEFVIDSLGSVGQQAAKAKLQQLESKLTAVTEQIERARSTAKTDERSAEAVADDMIAKLTKVAGTLQAFPMPALRSLLMTLIDRLEVNMATKGIQITLAIPADMGANALCLEDKSVQKSVNQAQMKIPLESAECSYRRIDRTPCFDCRRRAA
jgi:hypothetical protein